MEILIRFFLPKNYSSSPDNSCAKITALLDSRGRQGCAPLPLGIQIFIFMQFSAESLQNNRSAHPLRKILDPPLYLVLSSYWIDGQVFRDGGPLVGEGEGTFTTRWLDGRGTRSATFTVQRFLTCLFCEVLVQVFSFFFYLVLRYDFSVGCHVFHEVTISFIFFFHLCCWVWNQLQLCVLELVGSVERNQ